MRCRYLREEREPFARASTFPSILYLDHCDPPSTRRASKSFPSSSEAVAITSSRDILPQQRNLDAPAAQTPALCGRSKGGEMLDPTAQPHQMYEKHFRKLRQHSDKCLHTNAGTDLCHAIRKWSIHTCSRPLSRTQMLKADVKKHLDKAAADNRTVVE